MFIRDEWDLADLEVKAQKEDVLEIIKVSGCGISAVGVKGSQSLVWILKQIIEKGGVPEVTRL